MGARGKFQQRLQPVQIGGQPGRALGESGESRQEKKHVRLFGRQGELGRVAPGARRSSGAAIEQAQDAVATVRKILPAGGRRDGVGLRPLGKRRDRAR